MARTSPRSEGTNKVSLRPAVVLEECAPPAAAATAPLRFLSGNPLAPAILLCQRENAVG